MGRMSDVIIIEITGCSKLVARPLVVNILIVVGVFEDEVVVVVVVVGGGSGGHGELGNLFGQLFNIVYRVI